jgi:collagen type III alpha
VIGYLAKEQAARYVGVLSALMENGHIPTTACHVWAYAYQDWQGTDRRGRDIYRPVMEARASIVLDEPHLCVPANLPPSTAHRMLPHGGALQVKGEEDHLDVLAPLVSEHGETWVYTTLHLMTVGSGRTEKRVVELRIDGKPIGRLTPTMSAQYAATIDHVAQSGQLVAAKALLKGNPIQVEAVLHASRSHELDAAWFAPTGSRVAAPPSSPREENEGGSLPAFVEPAVRPIGSPPISIPPKPSEILFQVPPGWPSPPEGWEPFDGWQPDPAWPSPPPGWQFWTVR